MINKDNTPWSEVDSSVHELSSLSYNLKFSALNISLQDSLLCLYFLFKVLTTPSISLKASAFYLFSGTLEYC